MNFLEKLKAVTALVLAKLGLSELPMKDGKIDFSEEQKTKLVEELGEERVTQMIVAFDSELKAYHDTQASLTSQLNAVDEELKKILAKPQARSDLDDENNPESNESQDPVLNAQELSKIYDKLSTKNAELEQKVEALIRLPEQDNPLMKNKEVMQRLKHSATHLFASGKDYDLLTRNWNARLLDPSLSATNFTDPVTIATLNNDLKLYYREYPDELKSLERDNFDLPPFWSKITKVSSEIFKASVVTAEITQSRKLSWLPKNKHHIEAEKGRVYPIQIDIEYIGHYLQRIEESWLNFMNNEGSQPYKMRFVAFLVNEIRKKQRVEDRIASINGIYVPTPKDATIPGKFLNRQNGLRYLLWRARDVEKKYRPFNLGTPTRTNIIDYEENFISSLPPEVRILPNLVFYKSPSWLKIYKDRYEELYGQNTDYKGMPVNPRNYSNIEYCTLPDLEGSDFMFITTKDNISILEMLPAERGMYNFEYFLRNIYIWADYKMGIMLHHIGNHKIKPTDPDAFKVQTVWSNNVPIFENRYKAYLYDDKTGEIKANHNFISVNPDWKTDISEIKPLYPGQVLKITGDTSLSISKNIKKSASLNLISDFDLKSGGTLTMVSLDREGKWQELFRTTEPEMIPLTVLFTDVIDTTTAVNLQFNGTSDTILSAISGGVQNQLITIHGGNNGKLIIPKNLENLKIDTDIELADATAQVQLIHVDNLWYKFKKS